MMAPLSFRSIGRLIASLGALGLIALPTLVAAADATTATVVRVVQTPGGVDAVVSLPLAQSRIFVPPRQWSATVNGRSVPFTTSRLVGANLQVIVVIGRRGPVEAETGAASELLHELPASTPAGVAVGTRIVGTTRNSALAALARLDLRHGLPTALSAAVRAPAVGSRRAIVVFARCSALPRAVGSLPQGTTTQELDVVGLGTDCSPLAAQLSSRAGVVASRQPGDSGMVAGADDIANRLLGEYLVTVRSGSAPTVDLEVRGQRTRSSAVISTGFVAQSDDLSTGARVAIGTGVALVILAAAALYRRRRHVTG